MSTKRERLDKIINAYNRLQEIDKDCPLSIELKKTIENYMNNYNKKIKI